MTEAQLVAALLSPVIFISAAGLLLLSLNTRLMGIVSRLRSFHWECHQKERAGAHEEAKALELQIQAITRRAVLVRNAFLWVLVSVFLALVTCLLLGLAALWPAAYAVAIPFFVLGFVAMLAGVGYYLAEVAIALAAVREEERILSLLDLKVREERHTT
ncbi:MAG: DUF2721 domain-containing protein [Nitrospinota bacterium]